MAAAISTGLPSGFCVTFLVSSGVMFLFVSASTYTGTAEGITQDFSRKHNVLPNTRRQSALVNLSYLCQAAACMHSTSENRHMIRKCKPCRRSHHEFDRGTPYG
eukprot:GHVU01116256.1.p2 GENE.GHVU01116256.1~~GHVU01116256.1.p2  ORF type:complete len:104 (-),score=0.22 GHVU01116256.1:484-795(-)